MSVLHVTTQGAVLRRRSRRLEVEAEGERLLSLPVGRLERLVLHGAVALSTPALALLLDEGVSVAFVTTRGRYRGELAGPLSKDVFRRIAQVDRSRDPAFRLAFASDLVRLKLARTDETLRRFAANHPEPALLEAARRVRCAAERIPDAGDLDRLRGLEGEAAAAWFGVLGRMLRNGMEFPGRRRRPPPDPVNALLSYLYVLVAAEAASAVAAVGLDPAIGFYHDLRYGRASLALDLLEPLRPLIERFALAVLNTRVLRAEHFVQCGPAGVRLRDGARSRLLRAYERRLAAAGPRAYGLRPALRDAATRVRDLVKRGLVQEAPPESRHG